MLATPRKTWWMVLEWMWKFWTVLEENIFVSFWYLMLLVKVFLSKYLWDYMVKMIAILVHSMMPSATRHYWLRGELNIGRDCALFNRRIRKIRQSLSHWQMMSECCVVWHLSFVILYFVLSCFVENTYQRVHLTFMCLLESALEVRFSDFSNLIMWCVSLLCVSWHFSRHSCAYFHVCIFCNVTPSVTDSYLYLKINFISEKNVASFIKFLSCQMTVVYWMW